LQRFRKIFWWATFILAKKDAILPFYEPKITNRLKLNESTARTPSFRISNQTRETGPF
jgi:hypothetical protein